MPFTRIRRLTPLAALAATLGVTTAAHADTPVVDDKVLAAPCAAAKALDECPACKCELETQTSPYPGLDESASSILVGAVLRVSGEKDGGDSYQASHVLLGTTTKLEHVGRLAETSQIGPVAATTYTVEGANQAFQMCPGGCDFEAVGLIHPFIVTTVTTSFDMESPAETANEEKHLVLCFDGLGGLMCNALPIARELRKSLPGSSESAPRKVTSREGYTRTWKFGAAGDLVLGKATGKLAKNLGRPEAHNVPIVMIGAEPGAKPLDR